MKGWAEVAEQNMKRIWISIAIIAVWNAVLTVLVVLL